MKRKTVYVVAIPWDSASISSVRVFELRRHADDYATKVNEVGYHGYTGGVCVNECEIEP
jgi:hypothetical protein